VGRQGYNIAPDNFGKIAKSVPQVVGIKDTSYSIPQLQELVSKFGENYTIIGAGDTLIYAAFMTGAPAFISGISNVFPRLTIDIYEAVKRGNYEKARELQFELNKLRAILKKGPTITPYKEALKILQGIDLGTVSSPLRPMTKREIEELKSELRELGILT
jgi:dihydrodipicolinate synthase/N-acetylneuraminate lyase